MLTNISQQLIRFTNKSHVQEQCSSIIKKANIINNQRFFIIKNNNYYYNHKYNKLKHQSLVWLNRKTRINFKEASLDNSSCKFLSDQTKSFPITCLPDIKLLIKNRVDSKICREFMYNSFIDKIFNLRNKLLLLQLRRVSQIYQYPDNFQLSSSSLSIKTNSTILSQAIIKPWTTNNNTRPDARRFISTSIPTNLFKNKKTKNEKKSDSIQNSCTLLQSQISDDMNETSTSSASTVTRLTIQSPPPPPPPKININNTDETTNQATATTIQSLYNNENPISQVERKQSKNRGFFSQLLCCFRPSSSVYYSVCNRTDVKWNDCKTNQPIYYGKPLLPPKEKGDDRICMVIDLDETLVHSSFKPIDNADFIVPIEIDGSPHQVYVLKRPNVDEFLRKMGHLYECVLFTASLARYADPVADLLDKDKMLKARLFRESCSFYRGNYVKDLSRLGRDLNRVIIVDNSPASYIFHPQNAVPVQSWFDDPQDTELLDLIPFLESLSSATNVHQTLQESRRKR